MSSGRVAIVGASGYTGAELIRLLLGHPRAEVVGLYARRAAGSNIDEVFPQLAGVSSMAIEEFDADAVAERADIAFCALPHGHSARAVAALRERDLLVVDLSADFRLRDVDVYDAWYASADEPTHPTPGLFAEAVYGLPERYRAELRAARLIAAPGCYPTSAILAAAPLLDARLIQPERLIVDAKSGVSGAGRAPAQAFHFPEVGEGVRAYKVGGTHRHTPEMEQELSRAAGQPLHVLFTPHLIPMSRGIFACVYGEPTDASRTAADYQMALEQAYAGEPFVTVLPPGRVPDTAHVRGSNRAQVAVSFDPRTNRVLCMAAIDNLVKGASGQAVQAMNLARGWDESLGLGLGAIFP
jgi:N-acetyl-gamma-glutamyl-phosphate reductase